MQKEFDVISSVSESWDLAFNLSIEVVLAGN